MEVIILYRDLKSNEEDAIFLFKCERRPFTMMNESTVQKRVQNSGILILGTKVTIIPYAWLPVQCRPHTRTVD